MLTNRHARRVMLLLVIAELRAKTRIRDFSEDDETRVQLFALVIPMMRPGYAQLTAKTASGFVLFMQQDSYRGNDGVPPSMHRYVYSINNPINYTDPTGHAATPSIGGMFGTLTALLVVLFLGAMTLAACYFNVIHLIESGWNTSASAYSCAIGIISLFAKTPLIGWFSGVAGFFMSMADWYTMYVLGDIDLVTLKYVFFAELMGNALSFVFGLQAGKALYEGAQKWSFGKGWQNAADVPGFAMWGSLAVIASSWADIGAEHIKTSYENRNRR